MILQCLWIHGSLYLSSQTHIGRITHHQTATGIKHAIANFEKLSRTAKMFYQPEADYHVQALDIYRGVEKIPDYYTYVRIGIIQTGFQGGPLAGIQAKKKNILSSQGRNH